MYWAHSISSSQVLCAHLIKKKLENVMDKLTQLKYLNNALKSTHGIELQFSSPEDADSCKRSLYPIKKQIEEYANISIINKSTKLWLIKK